VSLACDTILGRRANDNNSSADLLCNATRNDLPYSKDLQIPLPAFLFLFLFYFILFYLFVFISPPRLDHAAFFFVNNNVSSYFRERD